MRSKGGAANFKVGEGVNTVKTLKSKKKWGVYDHPPPPPAPMVAAFDYIEETCLTCALLFGILI